MSLSNHGRGLLNRKRTIRNTTIPFFVLASLILGFQTSYASWLIDPEKFHISAHGQTACQDCHEKIIEQDLHPNPDNVNKKLQDFFSVDNCLSCHDNVMDDLNENVHGTMKVEEPQKYENCLKCHNPHYQLSLEVEKGQFDPAKPRREQCGACHETRTSLPPPSDEDRACLECHRAIDLQEPQRKDKTSRLCFHCHSLGKTMAQEMTGKRVSLIDSAEYRSVPHAGIACTDCHLEADQFNHVNQRMKNCRHCHLPHDEKVAHDSHMLVACEACHLTGVNPVRDPESRLVLWERKRLKTGEPSRIHEMLPADDETACLRCHVKGNQVGAVSMILPAKSIICMPCHTATFSVGDTTTILALIVFLIGIVMLFSYWLSGATPGGRHDGPIGRLFDLLWSGIRSLFSRKIFLIVKAMILDVFLQRRLFRQSGARWLIHSLIFFPFVFRFFWGLIALITSLWAPECPVTWPMLDKNHPVTAFLFDVTGIMVILGAVLAFIRGFLRKSEKLPGLPGQDRMALSLIGGIVVIGFILEGLRIAMTGSPAGACYAFIGYAVSTLFSDSAGLTQSYGYIWYIHAILTGIFIAYLPFSRMFHIIMGPIVLAMNAVSEHEHIRR
jgi:nitrate reductase gamma subunit